ncbi:hypothetical protein ACLOJK_012639 [Asimina triloba]
MYTDYGAPPEHLLWCSIVFINGQQPWLPAAFDLHLPHTAAIENYHLRGFDRLIEAVQENDDVAGNPDPKRLQPVSTVSSDISGDSVHPFQRWRPILTAGDTSDSTVSRRRLLPPPSTTTPASSYSIRSGERTK